MVRNSLISSVAALAFIGLAACGQDQSELPADDFPAAEAPATAPEADLYQPETVESFEQAEPVEQDADLDAPLLEEGELEEETEAEETTDY